MLPKSIDFRSIEGYFPDAGLNLTLKCYDSFTSSTYLYSIHPPIKFGRLTNSVMINIF
jgi:hypothetical protein